MSQDQSVQTIPQKDRIPNRQKDNFSPVGDLFAPFFDVVFYRSTPEVGLVASLEEQASLLDQNPFTRAAAAQLRAQARSLFGAQQAALESTDTIGQGRIELRSVAGGLVSYSPAGDDDPLAGLVNFRSNLQVSMVSAAALQATLTLDAPYEAALQIIDNKLIKFGSLMEIQWGYLSADGRKPAVSDKGLFRITQPSIKFGQKTSITIGGFDILSSSLGSAETRCQWLREKYPCDLDIIREIVSKKLKGSINDKRLSNESALRKRKSGTGVVQADDDWTFFRRILRQNNVGWTQNFKTNTVELFDERVVNNLTPKYRLLWYQQPENEKDIPMISFETNPILSLFAGPKGARGQRTICRDPETKKVVVINKDPANTGVTGVGEKNTTTTEKGFPKDVVKTSTGQVGVYAPLDAACASGRFFTQPCRRPNQMEETERENYEMSLFNTKARATCPGVPGLIPQQTCEIKGVGDTFSGTYRIMKVTHNVGAGYTVDVDLLRTASSGVKGSGDPGKKDSVNTKPVNKEASTGETVEPILEGDVSETTRGGCVDEQATAQKQQVRDEAAAARRKAQAGGA